MLTKPAWIWYKILFYYVQQMLSIWCNDAKSFSFEITINYILKYIQI